MRAVVAAARTSVSSVTAMDASPSGHAPEAPVREAHGDGQGSKPHKEKSKHKEKSHKHKHRDGHKEKKRRREEEEVGAADSPEEGEIPDAAIAATKPTAAGHPADPVSLADLTTATGRSGRADQDALRGAGVVKSR